MINRYASLRQGLVGCWIPSLGASGYRLLDRSGNNNHGTLQNMDPGTDWVPSGGKLALDFDGTDDYVKFPNAFYKMPFSVSMWALARNTTTAHTIFGIGNSTTIDPLFQVSFRGDQANDPIIAAMRGNDNTLNTFSAFNNYQANTWYHIAAVFYGASNRLVFVNGISGTRDTTTHTIEPLNQMSLGVLLRTSPVSYLNGQIDDVRQYNRALTPSEIQLLYTGGRGVGLLPERIKHRRKTAAAATNRRRRLICGANC